MKTQLRLFHGITTLPERSYMKQIHGYHKGECDPKEGRQLTLCGQPIHAIDRHTINVPDLEQLSPPAAKLTCSNCLARLSNARKDKRTNYITKHTG